MYQNSLEGTEKSALLRTGLSHTISRSYIILSLKSLVFGLFKVIVVNDVLANYMHVYDRPPYTQTALHVEENLCAELVENRNENYCLPTQILML